VSSSSRNTKPKATTQKSTSSLPFESVLETNASRPPPPSRTHRSMSAMPQLATLVEETTSEKRQAHPDQQIALSWSSKVGSKRPQPRGPSIFRIEESNDDDNGARLHSADDVPSLLHVLQNCSKETAPTDLDAGRHSTTAKIATNPVASVSRHTQEAHTVQLPHLVLQDRTAISLKPGVNLDCVTLYFRVKIANALSLTTVQPSPDEILSSIGRVPSLPPNARAVMNDLRMDVLWYLRHVTCHLRLVRCQNVSVAHSL